MRQASGLEFAQALADLVGHGDDVFDVSAGECDVNHQRHLADWFGGKTLAACCAPTSQGVWRGQAQRSTLDQWTGAATLDAQLLTT